MCSTFQNGFRAVCVSPMLVAVHSKFFKNIYSTWIKKSFCLDAWVSSLSVMCYCYGQAVVWGFF